MEQFFLITGAVALGEIIGSGVYNAISFFLAKKYLKKVQELNKQMEENSCSMLKDMEDFVESIPKE